MKYEFKYKGTKQIEADNYEHAFDKFTDALAEGKIIPERIEVVTYEEETTDTIY